MTETWRADEGVMVVEKATRAAQLQNDDTDRTCVQADGYFLGATPEGELVVAFDLGGSAQAGVFLDRAAAIDFLDRYTAEMQEMGFLS